MSAPIGILDSLTLEQSEVTDTKVAILKDNRGEEKMVRRQDSFSAVTDGALSGMVAMAIETHYGIWALGNNGDDHRIDCHPNVSHRNDYGIGIMIRRLQ
jgi:hypothetical protein